MQHCVPVTIKLYDPFEDLKVIGVAKNISKLHGRFKVEDDWFNIDDIESVAVDNEPC